MVSNGFNMDLRAQQEWSWLLAIWLFLGGSGSGLFLLYLSFGLPPLYGAVALALILVGGIDLLIELGSPLRAWRTVFRAGTSWLSRGACCVSLFIVAAALSVAPRLEFLSPFVPLHNSLALQALGWFAGLCAVVIILYPAFFFRSTSRAVPFWNTPLLLLFFVSYAVLGGAGVMLVLTPIVGAPAQIESLAVALIVLNAVMVAIHLADMQRAGGSAAESVRLLNRAPLSFLFWIGVVLIGMVLPLVELLFLRSTPVAAGAFILIGGFLFRYCLLKAGVYVPISVVPAGVDLSRLNRTSGNFEREYAGMITQRAGRPG
jgi:formate-dependent nitrite reductase membrane component NrfD